MIRFSILFLLVVCMSMSVVIVYAQEDIVRGATIKGEVIDTSPEQNPIEGATVKIVKSADGQEYIVTTDKDGTYERTGLPMGRYMINVHKDGYGERVGKSKVVAAGGEIYDKIKMRKKDNILTFFIGQVFTWQLVVGFALGFLVALIMGSGRSRV